jgi:erythromycin esterase-like protein
MDSFAITFMRKYLLLLLAFTQIQSVFCQSRIKEFVVGNSHTINSISISDTNDSELRIIGDAIGESRIVMLGEQDHGDAPTFRAKARLIRYLHEQHGFNVLAFESDFYGLTGGYGEVTTGVVGLDSMLRGNLFPIWTQCAEFSDTWNYIQYSAKTSNPIHLAGIDNQLHGAFTGRHLNKLVTGIFSENKSLQSFENFDDTKYLRILDSIVKYSARGVVPNSQSELEWFAKQTDLLLGQLNALIEFDSFTIMALQNIRSASRHMQLYKDQQNYNSVFEERDLQMAKNLEWLVTVRYPSEKIIVWAANGHISKNQFDVEPRKFRHDSFGAFFTKQLGNANQTYVLGFSSFEGNAGRTTQNGNKYQLPAREGNSFERWISKPGREYGFVNFRDFNQTNPGYSKYFTMSASNHFQQKGTWHKAFDGVFFIRKMYACEKIE